MRRLIFILIIALTIPFQGAFAQQNKKNKQDVYVNDKPAYVIYDKEGNKVTYTEMTKELYKYDICLFGEIHNDPISHFLERTITEDLFEEKGSNLVIGGEMWETDQQLIMDEMIIYNLIDKESYLESAKNWNNLRDYKPLIGIAARNKLKFVCTNIPRRYAKIIYKKGIEYLDSLPQAAYQYLPPMPIHFDLEQPTYKNLLSVFGSDDQAKPEDKGNPMLAYKGTNLVKAQAIKDATMAYFILQNWKKGKYFMHYNGMFHSKNYASIYYYLKYYNPEVNIVTISMSEQANNLELEDMNKSANFNIVVNKSMTKTYEQKLF